MGGDRNSIYNMSHFFMWNTEEVDMMENDTKRISYRDRQGLPTRIKYIGT